MGHNFLRLKFKYYEKDKEQPFASKVNAINSWRIKQSGISEVVFVFCLIVEKKDFRNYHLQYVRLFSMHKLCVSKNWLHY